MKKIGRRGLLSLFLGASVTATVKVAAAAAPAARSNLRDGVLTIAEAREKFGVPVVFPGEPIRIVNV